MSGSNDNGSFVDELLAHARDEVGRENAIFWSWKDDGREFAGIFVEASTAEYEDKTIPVRVYHRPDHGDYRTLWLWDSPQRLRELHDELDPQPGDYVYIRVDEKRPKRDKPGEFWTPVSMKVFEKAAVDEIANRLDDDVVLSQADVDRHKAERDEHTETSLQAERDERDELVDDHGARIEY